MSATINVPVSIISAAAHAMAKEDIRYYLNGLMIEKSPHGGVRVVATNGHHLIAIRAIGATIKQRVKSQYIIPRKTIEVIVKAGKSGGMVEFKISSNGSFSARVGEATFHGDLIDGKFADWERAMPDDDSLSGPVEIAGHYIESVIKANAALCKLEGQGVRYNGVTWHMRGEKAPAVAVFGQSIEGIHAIAVVMPVFNRNAASFKETKV
ncbi:MAG: hypothetical protein [Bacteriophage sp.]|nr:MAG: hypothetical protein [Bacteriophage sp.]